MYVGEYIDICTYLYRVYTWHSRGLVIETAAIGSVRPKNGFSKKIKKFLTEIHPI